MTQMVTLYASTRGLNNAVDPSRLRCNFETGDVDLAEAVNVVVTPQGRISRRLGLSQKSSVAVSQAYSYEGDCLFLSGGTLYRLNPDYSRTALRANLSGRIAFTGHGGRIYWQCGTDRGVVTVHGGNTLWTCPAYVGPETNRHFVDPPSGHLLGAHGSRVLVGVDSTLYLSEPFAPGRFCLGDSFIPHSSRVTMVASLGSGVYVSDKNNVHFHMGADLKNTEYIPRVSPSGAIEGSGVVTHGSYFGFPGKVALWTAKDGVYLGTQDGQVRPLTWDEELRTSRLVFPAAERSTAAVFTQNNAAYYIVLLQE